MGPTRPPLSVVIPSRDRPAQLDACLRSLAAVLSSQDEMIVVDSASSIDSYPAIVARHGAVYLRAPRPGASLARNLGWRAAHHGVVAFIDDDARVKPGWADALTSAFGDPRVQFVTGSIRAADGARAEGPLPRMHGEVPLVLEPGTRGAIGASANLAVEREMLETVGGFDEDLGPGRWFRAAEDVDLFDRLFLAGARGVYEPGAGVEHDQWRDRRAMLRLDYGYGIGMGARLARLWRTDAARARVETRDLLWLHGLRRVGADLLAGRQLDAATGLLRFIGTMLAFPLALARLPAVPRRR